MNRSLRVRLEEQNPLFQLPSHLLKFQCVTLNQFRYLLRLKCLQQMLPLPIWVLHQLPTEMLQPLQVFSGI